MQTPGLAPRPRVRLTTERIVRKWSQRELADMNWYQHGEHQSLGTRPDSTRPLLSRKTLCTLQQK